MEFEDIQRICRDHSGLSDILITHETRVAEDLRIYGDDAKELLMAINDKYGTCFEAFPYSDYFANECSADMHVLSLSLPQKHLILRIWDFPFLCFWKLFSTGKKYKSLTVGELLECIERGHW